MKSEADIVEVTVMEVFREEKLVRRVHAGSKSVPDRLLILWQEYRNQQRSGLSLVHAASQLLHHFKYCIYNILNIILYVGFYWG